MAKLTVTMNDNKNIVCFLKQKKILSISLFHTGNPAIFDSHVDDLLANGFTHIRVGSPDWNDEWNSIDRAKSAVLRAIAKGAIVSWGITQSFTITASNWGAFRQAILDTALWCQNNGVYEFKIGNEEELHIDRTTITVPQIIANINNVATEVKQIFTRGKVSYAAFQGNIYDWIQAGKGNIDLLTSNIYRGWETYNNGNDEHGWDWKERINRLINAFGVNGTYLTEFSLNSTSLDHYSTNENVQQTALQEMIDYIKASGMKKAVFFMYHDMDWIDGFGARRIDGSYRKIWDTLLANVTNF